MKEEVLVMIQNMFSLGQKQSSHLFHILMECMEHRESVSVISTLTFLYLNLLLHFLPFLWWVGMDTAVVKVMVLSLK